MAPSRPFIFKGGDMRVKRKAVTLIELLIIVLIIAAMTFVAIPRFSMATAKAGKAAAMAQKIAAGIRYTRSLAISNAATNTQGFGLNMTGSGSYTGFQIVDLSSSTVIKTESIDASVNCTGANDFRFGPLGNRLIDSDSLTIGGGGKTFSVTVTSATGMVKCARL
jgi:Tfp pilus assembly protein FimT